MRRWSVWLLWKKLHDCRRADAAQVEGATCQDKVQQLVITPGLRTVSAWSRRAHEHQSVGTAQSCSDSDTRLEYFRVIGWKRKHVHYQLPCSLQCTALICPFLMTDALPDIARRMCGLHTRLPSHGRRVCKPLHSILLAAEKRCGHHGATCWFMNRRLSGSGVLH